MTGDHSLHDLAPGVYAWAPADPLCGEPNAGVVIAEDGLTVVDPLTTVGQAAPLAAELDALIDRPVRRLVYTASHLEHVGGSPAFPLAAVYGSSQTSHHLDQPADLGVLRALYPAHPDAGDPPARPVTHTVTEAAYLCPASIAVPVRGHQFENLVVQVPAAGVVFCGALASFGVVPLAFDADVEAWIATIDQLLDMGTSFVPGHGPIGGPDDLRRFASYLEAVDAAARAGSTRVAPGPWDTWTRSTWTPINVERAAALAAGDPSPPAGLRSLLG